MNILKYNIFKIIKFFLFSIFLFYLLLTVGSFAVNAFSTSDFNVYFTNVVYNDNGMAKITNDGKSINFDCNFEKVNTEFVMRFDVINDGDTDAIVDIFKLTGLTPQNDKFLNYYIKYDDGTVIKKGDILRAKSYKKIKVVVSYILDEDIKLEELPNENTTLDLGFQLYYAEKLN